MVWGTFSCLSVCLGDHPIIRTYEGAFSASAASRSRSPARPLTAMNIMGLPRETRMQAAGNDSLAKAKSIPKCGLLPSRKIV
jgi:hypothetical protein